MKFVRRAVLFLIGVTMGTILVMYMFGDREIGCSYFPNDRVLSDLSEKQLLFTDQTQCISDCIEASGDSAFYSKVLTASDVDFSFNERGTDKNCNNYKLDFTDDRGTFTLIFKNCKDSTATIKEIVLPEGIDCDCDL